MLGRDVWRDTGALRAVGASDAQTIFDDGEPGMDSDSLGTEVDGIERDSTSLARRGCTPLQDHTQACVASGERLFPSCIPTRPPGYRS